MVCACTYAAQQNSLVIKEKTILIDNRIPSIFSYPQYTDRQTKQLSAVLLLHGFGSHKNEVGNMYERLAHKLAKNGIASLRIDFTGWGDSHEPMENSNLDNMLSDAKMAYQFLQKNNLINSKKIAITGFSLGAYIGFKLAKFEKNSIALVMLSPVGNPPIELGHSLHVKSLDPSDKREKNEFDLGWRTISLGKSFFASLQSSPSLKQLGKLDIPILAISANEDESHHYLTTIIQSSPKDNVMITLYKSDHIFGIKTTHDQSEMVIDFVNDWLANNVNKAP